MQLKPAQVTQLKEEMSRYLRMSTEDSFRDRYRGETGYGAEHRGWESFMREAVRIIGATRGTTD